MNQCGCIIIWHVWRWFRYYCYQRYFHFSSYKSSLKTNYILLSSYPWRGHYFFKTSATQDCQESLKELYVYAVCIVNGMISCISMKNLPVITLFRYIPVYSPEKCWGMLICSLHFGTRLIFTEMHLIANGRELNWVHILFFRLYRTGGEYLQDDYYL